MKSKLTLKFSGKKMTRRPKLFLSSFFRKKHVTGFTSGLLIISFLLMVHGCYFYKASTVTKPVNEKISTVNDQNSFVIVHDGQKTWWLNNFTLDKDTIKGTRVNYIGKHSSYLKANPDNVNTYKRKVARTAVVPMINIVGPVKYKNENIVSIPLTSLTKSQAQAKSSIVSYLSQKPEIVEARLGKINWLLLKPVLINDTISSEYVEFNKKLGVGSEIHIYPDTVLYSYDQQVSIPVSGLGRVEQYDPATGANVAFYGTIGLIYITAALAMGALMIYGIFYFFIWLGSLCPLIYVWDGEKYVFTGEIYSGAMYEPLERHDYLKLPDRNSLNNEYRIMISNEMHQEQFNNICELKVIDHPSRLDILTDKYGTFHTVTDVREPEKATSFTGADISILVNKRDSLIYTGEPLSEDLSLTDGLILEFSVPAAEKDVKLVVRAKNTLWLEYVMLRFQSLFGRHYDAWVEEQEDRTPQQLQAEIMDQNIPMSVYLERDGAWEFIDYFNPSGAFVLKDDILTVPLPENVQGRVKIKLEYGTLFWEIDYVGVDCTPDEKIIIRTVPLSGAVAENGKDVSTALMYDDDQYYIQPEIGNKAIVGFKLPPQTSEARTLYLHTKGYYRMLGDFRGMPDKKKLETFLNPGRFNSFSEELVREVLNKEATR